MSRWTRDELIGADLIWLLTITYAGREVRWSSRPCVTTAEDGTMRVYDGGLDVPEVSRAIQGPGAEAELPAQSFDLLFPPDMDLPALIEAGHSLAGCAGELALWADGTAHDARRVYLRGRTESPEYDDADTLVSITLTAEPWRDVTLYPPVEATITTTTWPEATDNVQGLSYPVIIGCPGQYGPDPLNTDLRTSGSPAYAVEWTTTNVDTLLVADGRVQATSAILFADGNGQGLVNITTRTDGAGRVVSVMDLTGGGVNRTASEYHVGWLVEQGGGIMGPQGGTMRGAGDVLAWALRESGRSIDEGAFAAVAAALNAYLIGACIEEPCDMWEWAVEHVLPLVPAELMHTGEAIRPVLWRIDATEPQAVEHLDADEGGNVQRASTVAYSSLDDLANDIRLAWAYRLRAGDYKRTTSLVAQPDGTDESQIAHVAARRSAGRYGRRSLAMESEVVYDSGTAGAVLAWMALAYAMPRREVSYDAGQELGWLEPGDVVTITDDGRAWERRVAIVRAVRWASETAITLDLLIYTVPGRDAAA